MDTSYSLDADSKGSWDISRSKAIVSKDIHSLRAREYLINTLLSNKSLKLLVFSLQSPIPVSLLQLDPSDVALNRLAVECFLGTLNLPLGTSTLFYRHWCSSESISPCSHHVLHGRLHVQRQRRRGACAVPSKGRSH